MDGDEHGQQGGALWAGRQSGDTDEHEVLPAVSPVETGPGTPAPVKLCRECAAQAQTEGAFCPYCGASYVRKKRLTRRLKVTLAVLLVVLLGGGAAAGILVKKHHDDQVAARKAAAAAAAKKKRDQAAARADEKRAHDRLERSLRRDTVRSLEKSVTKDAQNDVSTGLVDGPVLSTDCQPSGGANPISDLSQTTGEFSCLAVTKINDDGTESGYRYTANVNFQSGTYTWHFGG